MGLTAIECVHRGVLSTRANWQLVLVHWVQFLVLAVTTILGLVPPLIVLGLDVGLEESSPADLEGLWQLVEGLIPTSEQIAPLAAAIGLALVMWTFGFLSFCFIQGGIFGTLWAGDRQAPEGSPRSWHWFRTFQLSDAWGWGKKLVWRYFWLANLVMAIFLGWLVLPILLVAAAFWGNVRWGGPAAFGIGCGGFIPIAFGWLAIALWAQLALAAGARPNSGVLLASKEALRILGSRLGAMLFLLVLLLAAGLTMALAFGPMSVVADLAMGSGSVAALLATSGLTAAQWLVSSLVNVVFAGALIALVRSETGTVNPGEAA